MGSSGDIVAPPLSERAVSSQRAISSGGKNRALAGYFERTRELETQGENGKPGRKGEVYSGHKCEA